MERNMRRSSVTTLAEARERNPAISATEAMRRQLQLAMFGAITEGDMIGMIEKLKQMAAGGDLRAMKLFFELTVGQQPAARIQQAVLIQHIDDLPHEEPILSASPTAALPRSEDKVNEMTRRAANGESLFHPGDAVPGNGDLS